VLLAFCNNPTDVGETVVLVCEKGGIWEQIFLLLGYVSWGKGVKDAQTHLRVWLWQVEAHKPFKAVWACGRPFAIYQNPYLGPTTAAVNHGTEHHDSDGSERQSTNQTLKHCKGRQERLQSNCAT
jgi:hypothetical protein